MRLKKPMFCAFLILACLAAGCTYYEVTDPASGKTYYTNNWAMGMNPYVGTVKFPDAKSGKTVTLQSSEVRAISKSEFDAAVSGH